MPYQEMHTDEVREPTAVLYLPASHSTQVSEPTPPAYAPAGQLTVQESRVLGTTPEPPWHAVHSTVPVRVE